MQTIIKAGFAEQTIQKSRFLAAVCHCETELAVAAFLRALTAEHANAHHLAYAFRIKTIDGIIPRFSDAGEPSGTAGKPILQMLDGQQIINVAVGVIRYYGGINLGTGGLVRAYGGTAKMALQATQLAPFVEMQQLHLTVHLKQVDALLKMVTQLNGAVIAKQFDSNAHFQIQLPKAHSQALTAQFTSIKK